MSQSKIRVAIIGAGIGGVTCAISLLKLATNVEVDLYEAAARFGEIGAGLVVWPRTASLLQELGIDITPGATKHDPTSQTVNGGKLQMRKADQAEGFAFGEVVDMEHVARFHRAELLEILIKYLPASCHTHFSKKLDSYTELDDGSLELHFVGSTAVYDVLIGADGLKSAVRGSMYQSKGEDDDGNGRADDAQPKRTGFVVYRGLTPRETLEKAWPDHRVLNKPVAYCGKQKHIIAYPISKGRLINIAAFTWSGQTENTIHEGPWVEDSSKEHVVQQFGGWEAEAIALLECPEVYSQWTVNAVVSLPSYVRGRVALIGDAAHAMTPFQGSGAGQAIEDGYILATVLARITPTSDNSESIIRALKVYNTIRRPASQNVQRLSRANGLTYELNDDECQNISVQDSAAGMVPMELLAGINKKIEENFGWTWRTSIARDRDEAIRHMDEES